LLIQVHGKRGPTQKNGCGNLNGCHSFFGFLGEKFKGVASEAEAWKNPFTDVKIGQWYTDAVVWANANNIVTGYGDGLFGTDDNVTREQMAVILYRYAQYKGYDVTAATALDGYTDASTVSGWARTAMGWANGEGLITGRTATTLAPGGETTRAEVASILMRFVEDMAG
jgi:hypothetical protein